MNIITADLETFWDTDHSLTKMSPIAYCMDEKTQLISCAIKFNDEPSVVVFGQAEIEKAFAALPVGKSMLVAHNNSGFDAMIFAWRLGLKPRMWGCTKAMSMPINTKTCGNSLAALVEKYGIGVKDRTALYATKGKRLEDFTEAEIADMAIYNRNDTDQCYELFKRLRPHFTPQEMWLIDATIRMLVQPRLQVDQELLTKALKAEKRAKQRSILLLAKHLKTNGMASDGVAEAVTLEELEVAVRAELASTAKFASLLTSLGQTVPFKPSPTDPSKQVPALAKTDEAFTSMTESENEVVAAAARARLAVKSTILETRIKAFLDASTAVNGRFPVPLNYCGADTTGRWSGWAYNPQNLPRINPDKPKISDALRNSLLAPKGYQVVVADQSGIELRVNHFLWKVKSSMELYQADRKADLYRAFAAARYNIPPEQVSKSQRQLAKVAQLGLGFGAGWKTFQKVAKLMGGLELSDADAEGVTTDWREKYADIVKGWKDCHGALDHIHNKQRQPIDPWGLCHTCDEGIELPTGRIIRYPDLRQEQKEGDEQGYEWWYGQGRHKARIYAGKITENMVQALARDTIADNAVAFYKLTGYYPQLMVHDELVYVVPDSEAADCLTALQDIMRTPPRWWPELITDSEGDISHSYGSAK